MGPKIVRDNKLHPSQNNQVQLSCKLAALAGAKPLRNRCSGYLQIGCKLAVPEPKYANLQPVIEVVAATWQLGCNHFAPISITVAAAWHLVCNHFATVLTTSAAALQSSCTHFIAH